MTRISKFFGIATATALTAGLLLAQDPGVRAMRGKEGRPAARGERMRAFVAEYLDLTETQKAEAKSIFDAARQSAEPARQQARQIRQAMKDAVTGGKPESEIDRLAAQAGPVATQLAATRAKAMAKFWAILTPEQKEKAERLHDRIGNRLRGLR